MQNATLTLVRGDDQTVGLALVTAAGLPYNLSGCAFTFEGRDSTYFSPVIVGPIVVSQHLDYAGGLSSLPFVPSDTAGINDNRHWHSIKLLSADGKLTTLQAGDLYVVPR